MVKAEVELRYAPVIVGMEPAWRLEYRWDLKAMNPDDALRELRDRLDEAIAARTARAN